MPQADVVQQPFERVFVGGLRACRYARAGELTSTVHACQAPCYRAYVGTVPRPHPYYLGQETENNLFLNIVDPEKPLFYVDTFKLALAFIAKHYMAGEQIVIHCNLGASRSPSIALLFAAKMNWIPNTSYKEARKAFEKCYSGYHPGKGIATFLEENWNALLAEEPRREAVRPNLSKVQVE